MRASSPRTMSTQLCGPTRGATLAHRFSESTAGHSPPGIDAFGWHPTPRNAAAVPAPVAQVRSNACASSISGVRVGVLQKHPYRSGADEHDVGIACASACAQMRWSFFCCVLARTSIKARYTSRPCAVKALRQCSAWGSGRVTITRMWW